METSPGLSLNEEYQFYCLQVGHLFTAFARLENVLTSSLKLHLALNFAKPNDTRSMKLASAIYGSMRFKASRDTIKRILGAEAAPKATIDHIEGIFAQVGHIENLRDKIAHQSVAPAHSDMDGFWQVTDVINTRDLTKTQVWVFDTKAIAAASHDLLLSGELIGRKKVKAGAFGEFLDLAPPA